MLVDGHCSLCKGSTYFLAQRDVSDKLRFASQQSSVGKAILDDYDHKNLAGDTVVVVKDQSLYTESRAVIEILKTLGLFPPIYSTSSLGLSVIGCTDLLPGTGSRGSGGKTKTFVLSPKTDSAIRYLISHAWIVSVLVCQMTADNDATGPLPVITCHILVVLSVCKCGRRLKTYAMQADRGVTNRLLWNRHGKSDVLKTSLKRVLGTFQCLHRSTKHFLA